jgi:Alpha-galactosidase
MGWSSWNTYRVNISDSLIMRQAKAMVNKGLKDVGYRYINIDDGYFGGRSLSGDIITHLQRFPYGLKPTVDYIHALGLKAGIYTDAGRNTCGSFWDKDLSGIGVGMYGNEWVDATLFFKDLGFDFIKIDFCGGDGKQNFDNLNLDAKERYTQIKDVICKVTNKKVVLNVCRWNFPGTWVCEVGDSWRISPDINPSWRSVKNIISQNLYLSAYAGGGHYNDMDMLEIGRGLSAEEEKTHFGLWCMLSSPLLIGCNLETIPEASLKLLLNKELIEINQDKLALQAYVAKNENGVYLLVKDIKEFYGKSRAAAIYNSTDKDTTMEFSFTDINLSGNVLARDVFAQKNLGNFKNGVFKVNVPAHGSRIFTFTGEKREEQIVYEAETAYLPEYQELFNPIGFGSAY